MYKKYTAEEKQAFFDKNAEHWQKTGKKSRYMHQNFNKIRKRPIHTPL